MKDFYTFEQKIAYNQAKEDLNKVLQTKYHKIKKQFRDEKYIDKEHFNYLNGQLDLLRELLG